MCDAAVGRWSRPWVRSRASSMSALVGRITLLALRNFWGFRKFASISSSVPLPALESKKPCPPCNPADIPSFQNLKCFLDQIHLSFFLILSFFYKALSVSLSSSKPTTECKSQCCQNDYRHNENDLHYVSIFLSSSLFGN